MNILKLLTLSLVLLTGSIGFSKRSDIEKYPKQTVVDRAPAGDDDLNLFDEKTPAAKAIQKGLKNQEFSQHLAKVLGAFASSKVVCNEAKWKMREVPQFIESDSTRFEIVNYCSSESDIYSDFIVKINGTTSATGFDTSKLAIELRKESNE